MVLQSGDCDCLGEAQKSVGEICEPSWKAEPKVDTPQPPFKRQIVWFNAIGFLILHLAGVYSIYVAFFQCRLLTLAWTLFLMNFCGQGITMGAHRLYSHKAFKATPGLRLALVLMQTINGQNCMWVWVRDHRQHHKYSDTDADPHNARRGFFFSHIGWLMSRKHPDVIAKGKNIDMSDLNADKFVMFQKRYYKTLYVILALGFPVAVPIWAWSEDLFNSFMVAFIFRTVLTLNVTWLVNSAAHKYGTKPYTNDIVPVENWFVSTIGLGEGWHNYHHTFPWDYRAAELGMTPNLTTKLLDFCAKQGWAYDLREATSAMVTHRILKRGDGTHPISTSAPLPETILSEDKPLIREAVRQPGV